jgi:hypothetical protein
MSLYFIFITHNYIDLKKLQQLAQEELGLIFNSVGNSYGK